MRETEEAFLWIINILERNKVRYRVSGGLAARIYGSKRKLADIDIEIQDSGFRKILPEITKHIIWGPKGYKDKNMQTYGLSMKYKGQIIDLSGVKNEFLFDKKNKRWIKSKINLKKTTNRNVYGRKVRVIKKKDLIIYKKILLRNVDVLDLKQLLK